MGEEWKSVDCEALLMARNRSVLNINTIQINNLRESETKTLLFSFFPEKMSTFAAG